MTCRTIMTPAPVCLNGSDTVTEAVARLLSCDQPTLPVTDAKGQFVGVFGLREVLGLLLPRVVRLGDDLQDLSFVAETKEDLCARLGAVASDPVSRHMAPHRAVRAETALTEALLLLHRGDAFLPVVDENGRLAGMVTARDAVLAVAGAV